MRAIVAADVVVPVVVRGMALALKRRARHTPEKVGRELAEARPGRGGKRGEQRHDDGND
jgi:hypothetical protein